MTQFISKTASKLSLAITFTACLFVLGSSASGDEFDRIDNMAQKIQKKSRLLIKETVHYRHTPQYASLVDASTHLCNSATHVHEVAHFSNNLDHLQSDLADLDRYFHQLEGLFQATEDLASRGHGHVHGKTGHVKGLLRSIEASIDAMRRDVRKAQSKIVARHHDAGHGHSTGYYHGRTVQPRSAQPRTIQPRVVVPQYRPVYPQQSRSSGFSFSIGGGSSRLHFNF